MAMRQPNDTLEIQNWVTQFIDLLRDIHELEGPKAKDEQLVVRVTKLATTFNVEWLQYSATLRIVKSLGVDRESEILRTLLLDAINRFAHEAVQKQRDASGKTLRSAVARARLLAALDSPKNLGTYGRRTWTRDELHER
jgi:hypothetical protein